jgi:hypothetical protein
LVGNDTDPCDLKSRFESVNDRQQTVDIGGITWPHLTANRLALVIKNRADNHLDQIRPVVLAKSSLTDTFTAMALELQSNLCRMKF